jgi:hypothetical protein
MAARAPRRWRRRILALALGLGLTLVLGECALRLVLFRDVPLLHGLAQRLRRASLYTDVYHESAFWKLQYLWTAPEDRLPFPHASRFTGWTGWRIDPETLVTDEEPGIGERRPVLLYGDSFAECVTAPAQAFQGLLETTSAGRTHALVNFGTAGFGPDQSLLLLESTIERFAARRPLVIFSIFLDEDPERALLDFRGGAKPSFELRDGRLVLHPLEELDTQRWLDAHPARIASYLGRLLATRLHLLPAGLRARLFGIPGDDYVIALNRAFLARAHELLAARGIEHCVLGFHGQDMLEGPDRTRWREDFVRQACSELGLPFLSSRPYLLAAVDGDIGRLRESLFVGSGPLAGHYNARGNRAALEAILQAIRGDYTREDPSGVKQALLSISLDSRDAHALELFSLGKPARLEIHGEEPARCLREVGETGSHATRLLGLHPGFELPTQLEWKLERAAHFRADVRAVRSTQADSVAEAVRLRLLVDGVTQRSLELLPGAAPQTLEFALHAPCTFAIEVERVEGYARSAWARLDKPELR